MPGWVDVHALMPFCACASAAMVAACQVLRGQALPASSPVRPSQLGALVHSALVTVMEVDLNLGHSACKAPYVQTGGGSAWLSLRSVTPPAAGADTRPAPAPLQDYARKAEHTDLHHELAALNKAKVQVQREFEAFKELATQTARQNREETAKLLEENAALRNRWVGLGSRQEGLGPQVLRVHTSVGHGIMVALLH